MTLQQLIYAVKIADTKSMNKAATELFVSQPALSSTMRDLEEELQGQFFRIHKGYLVNLACIDEYNKTEVTLVNGDKLLISKYKYPDFVKAYLRYMQ